MIIKKNRNIFIYISLGVLFLPFILLIVQMVRHHNRSEYPSEISTICFEGQYSYDEKNWIQIPEDNNIPESKNRELYLRGQVSEEIPERMSIWFYIENMEVSIEVKGEEITKGSRSQGLPSMFRSSGSVWQRAVSPGITKEENVRIQLRFPYDNSQKKTDTFLNGLYMGDGGGLYRRMYEKFDWLTLAALVEVIAGWLYMLEGLIYEVSKMQEGRRVLLIGFCFFAGGIWCLTDSLYPYLSLVIYPPWLASVVDMSGILLLPIAIALLVRHFMKTAAANRIMNLILAVSVLTAAAATAIQLTGLADLYEQQFWIGRLGLLQIVVVIVCVAMELRQNKSRHIKLLFLTLCPTFIAIAGECINGIYPFMPTRILMRYGFFISAVLMILQFVSFANADTKMRKELMESRISVMLSQIQPHFLYNSLESIGALCIKDPIRAEEAITEFSLFLRSNIDSLGNTSLISFEQELLHTKYYLELEKLRFEERLKIRMDTPITRFSLPPLTLQPIVENAVRHGVMPKKEGGTVTIQTWEEDDAYFIMVRDDGMGLAGETESRKQGMHVGIANVRNRLEAQCEGELLITSIPAGGTTVILRIPKEKSNEHKNIGSR